MTPYQRIVNAAKHGKGVRLLAREVAQMARDTAIRQLAENDDNEQPFGPDWVAQKVEENQRGFGRKS